MEIIIMVNYILLGLWKMMTLMGVDAYAHKNISFTNKRSDTRRTLTGPCFPPKTMVIMRNTELAPFSSSIKVNIKSTALADRQLFFVYIIKHRNIYTVSPGAYA